MNNRSIYNAIQTGWRAKRVQKRQQFKAGRCEKSTRMGPKAASFAGHYR